MKKLHNALRTLVLLGVAVLVACPGPSKPETTSITPDPNPQITPDPNPAPIITDEFELSLSESVVVLYSGTPSEVLISLKAKNNSTGTAELSLEGLPAGFSSKFSQNPVKIGSNSLLSIISPEEVTKIDAKIVLTVKSKASTAKPELRIFGSNSDGNLGGFPGRYIEAKTLEVAGEKINYQVVDDLAVIQGDMILGKATDFEKAAANYKKAGLTVKGITCGAQASFLAEYIGCTKWDSSSISYQFANDWGSDAANARKRGQITSALQEISSKTGLRFVESNYGKYLYFQNSAGCSSYVGRDGPAGSPFQVRHIVNLKEPTPQSNTGCFRGQAIHEILHALGVWHEQSRSDRDNFVQISRDNIIPRTLYNFDIVNGINVGPYDLDSIMQYGCRDFGLDRSRNTTTPRDSTVPCSRLGQLNGLSDGDILSLLTIYPAQFTLNKSSETIGYGRANGIPTGFDLRAPRVSSLGRFVTWKNSAGQSIGAGFNPPTTNQAFTVGINRFTVDFTIRGVALFSGSFIVNFVNSPPVAIIENPPSGTNVCLGQPVTFTGSGRDGDGRITAYLWKYSRLGNFDFFGTAPTVTKTFTTAGTYTITLSVSDNDNAIVGSAPISIQVIDCDAAPRVSITNPIQDGNPNSPVGDFTQQYSIRLEGSATDAQGNAISGNNLVWRDDNGFANGVSILGFGNTLQAIIEVSCTNRHIISLTAIDGAGRSNTVLRRIYLNYLC